MIKSVSFYDQYELLDLVRDDGVKSFRARELATGRTVEVHVFANSLAPISRALLHRLDKLAYAEDGQPPPVLSRGDYEGTPYAVTLPLEGFSSLHEWVSSVAHPAAPDPADPDRLSLSGAGAWHVTPPPEPALEPLLNALTARPDLAPTQEAPLRPTRHPAPAPELSRESTLDSTLEPTAAAPSDALPSSAASAPAVPAGETDEDEFVRLFGAASAPEPAAPEPKLPPAQPAAAPPSKPAGEFTRMIQTLGSLPAAAEPRVTAPAPPAPAPPTPAPAIPAASAPLPGAAAPGEFTQMLRMTPQPSRESAPVPSAPEAAPAGANPAGEFTQMFRKPAEPAAPVIPPSSAAVQLPPAADRAATLDHTLEMPAPPSAAIPAPAPQPAAAPAARPSGEFTKAIQLASTNLKAPGPAAAGTAPTSAAPQAVPPGAFTRAIQTAMQPVPAAQSSPATPSAEPPGEFTRMIQAGDMPGPGVSGVPASGGAQVGEFTKMLQAPMAGGAFASRPGPGSIPEKAGAIDLSRYSDIPAGPMPQSPAVQRIQPQNPGGGGKPAGEYTQMFGSPHASPFSPPPAAAAPPAASQPGAGATNSFAVPQAPAYPQYPQPAGGGAYAGYNNPYDQYSAYGGAKPPSEFTQAFSAPAPELSLGKEPPKAPPPSAAPAAPYGAPPNPYGAAPTPPSPYGAPQPPTYGAPAQAAYGAPAPPAYGAPPSSPYGAPPTPAYGAPQPHQPYGSPPPAYGAPPQNYPQPGAYPAPLPAKTGALGGSKLPLILGGGGLLIAIILLILLFVTKK